VLDYAELVVQWGYLCLFGSALPAVVALAGIINFVETRTDGFKLLHDFRRVIPRRVDGVGEPLVIFGRLALLAVPLNAALAVFTFKAAREPLWMLGVVDRDGARGDGVGDGLVNLGTGEAFACLALGLAMYAGSGLAASLFPAELEQTAVQRGREALVLKHVLGGGGGGDDGSYDSYSDDEGHHHGLDLSAVNGKSPREVALAGDLHWQEMWARERASYRTVRSTLKATDMLQAKRPGGRAGDEYEESDDDSEGTKRKHAGKRKGGGLHTHGDRVAPADAWTLQHA